MGSGWWRALGAGRHGWSRELAAAVRPRLPRPRQAPTPRRDRNRSAGSLDRDPNCLGELAPDAVVNLGGEPGALLRRDLVEIEHILLAPVAHHLKPGKHIDII